MKKIKLICNNARDLYSTLKDSFKNCKGFYFIVSFIRFSGIQILLEVLKYAEENNIKGKIITSDYMGITEKKAISFLKKFKNIEIKIYDASKIGFHPKGYIFNYGNSSKVIIGSSNISKGGLKSNIEWSSEIFEANNSSYIEGVMSEFKYIWEKSFEYDENNFNERNNNYLHENELRTAIDIKPNLMQKTAIFNLNRTRENGGKKGLGIAATGSGKTFLAAFDIKNYQPQKILFIAHREELIYSAKNSFEKIIKNKKMGIYSGKIKEVDNEYIFSTIQSISKNYTKFSSEEFDYIVIDEAHHIIGETYQLVLNYFKPKFLLGLTATPQRSDGKSIYQYFDDNVIVEIRLKKALEENLVVPFHYYGISEVKNIEIEEKDFIELDQLAKKLMVHSRTQYIVEKMNFYGFSGKKRKVLGFCVNIAHAQYMEKEFNLLGIKSISLTSLDSYERRKLIIERLENESDELEVIFSVDIFNEGIDIKSINTILMLRPTNSGIIFTQQLGRGLRKFKDKEFLTVLDFIGNHRKSFLSTIVLMGDFNNDKDSLRTVIKTDFYSMSKNIHVSMDEILKENILKKIENESFNSLKYYKDEYFQFKNYILKGKIPNFVDYISYENSPNIINYITKEKSYYNFLERIGESKKESKRAFNKEEKNIIEELESFLPLRRINEFAIIKSLLKIDSISLNEGKNEIKKYINDIDLESVENSFKYLNQDFYDEREKSRKIKIFIFNKIDKRLYKSLEFKKLLLEEEFKEYIYQMLLYGILKYEEEFKNTPYKIPFLQLYSNYSMRDVALVSNYEKMHSSYRNGVNISSDKKKYYLFINLNKDEMINNKDFENKIIDNLHFFWYSKRTTAKNSETGKNFIFNKKRGITLHFFMRKYNQIEGITQPYIYIGTGDVISYEGEKPIKTKIRLHNKIPERLLVDFSLIC